MDDKILLIIILISGIYFYNSLIKNRFVEEMATVKGSFYKGKIGGKFSKSDYLNVGLGFLKKLPIIDPDTVKTAANLEIDKLLFEGKVVDITKIIKTMQTEMKDCGGNLKLTKQDLVNINDRKKLVKIMPFMKQKILEKINYNSIRCFVKKYDPNNYINILKTNKNFPDVFDMKNSIIVNDSIYKITHLGILKYKYTPIYKIDKRSNILNASFESTILNDINQHNNTNEEITILKGEPFKIRKNKIVDIKTNKVFEVKVSEVVNDEVDDEVDDEVEDEVEDESNNKLDKIKSKDDKEKELEISNTITTGNEFNIKSLFYINNKLYFLNGNKIYPNKGVGLKINKFKKENDLYINSVTTAYYYENSIVNYRILFICNSNLYFYYENGTISEIKYFDKDFGFKNNININQKLSCDQYNNVLSQLKLSNKISNEIRKNVLTSLKCKFN